MLRNSITHILDAYESHYKDQVRPPLPAQQLSQELQLKLPKDAVSEDELKRFCEQYLHYSVNTSDKSYMNQLWSKVEDPSIMGELLTSLANTSMYTYEVAPVATLMEQKMISTLCQEVWREDGVGEGVMTSGGSASNLQALLLARHKHFPQVKNEGLTGLEKKPMVICASNAHYSVKRSVNMLGLGQSNFIEVPCTAAGSLNPEDVQKAITQAKSAGGQPFALISTAGTTVEGSYDDLAALGTIARAENLWFHVDGAYGAGVLLSSSLKRLMKGIEFCDSLSWDFHKMLGINLTCAFLLVQEKGLLKSSLDSNNDSYLFHDDDSIDLGPKSMQCGRRTDITKLWLTWLSWGKSGLEKRLNDMYAATQMLGELVDASPEFTLLSPPSSFNVRFRVRSGDVVQIRDHLISHGKGMINYSQNEEGPFFRAVISNPSLNKDDLQLLLNNILEARDALGQS